MLFSVITPTWNRADGRLERALQSIRSQVCHDFEHIVVDDGSTDSTPAVCRRFHVRRIALPHGGRVIARNAGMKAARGEWLAWLDSDDAWDPMYLATFAHNIAEQPNVNLWVCGVVMHGVGREGDRHTVPTWTKLRSAWKPPLDETGQWVHADFASGLVGTGMFVFRKACLERTGYLPPWRTHLEIADGLDEYLGYTTGYSAAKRWVGNPWGDDHAMFRRLTQFYEVNLIEACLYIHYVR